MGYRKAINLNQPKNQKAVQEANEKIPIANTPELREQWMTAYIEASGEYEQIEPSGKKPSDVKEPCIECGDLIVTIRDVKNKFLLEDATVNIAGVENRTSITNVKGEVIFLGVKAGIYDITASKTTFNKEIKEFTVLKNTTNVTELKLSRCKDILVTKVIGPETAFLCNEDKFEYTVTNYNCDYVTENDKKNIKWKLDLFEIDNNDIEKFIRSQWFDAKGDKLGLKFPSEWKNHKVRVYPYIEKAIQKVSVSTKIECFDTTVNKANSLDDILKEDDDAKTGIYKYKCLYAVVFYSKTEMVPFIRTKEELFKDTVKNNSKYFCVAINGVYYDVTTSGKMDAGIGYDAVSADETTIEGNVIIDGETAINNPSPQLFYILENEGDYASGFGNPPRTTGNAIGGSGPMIINNLPYGSQNSYKEGVPEGSPLTGEPSEKYKKYLKIRSNATYADVNKGPMKGKTILAHSSKKNALLILVQEDGRCSISHDEIRNFLIKNEFDNAVFLDGSDSAMLYVSGKFLVKQGESKDETNTLGLGIRCGK